MGVIKVDGFITVDPIPHVKYIQLIMTFIRFYHSTFKRRLPAGKHSQIENEARAPSQKEEKCDHGGSTDPLLRPSLLKKCSLSI